MSGRRFTLPKTSRLHLKSDFGLLVSNGQQLRVFPLKAVYVWTEINPAKGTSHEKGNTANDGSNHSLPAISPSQAAFVVPKKLFKKATERNRIKRLMREAWRLNVLDLNDALKRKGRRLKTLLIFTGKELPDYATVSAKIILILQRLQKENEVASDQDHAGPDSHL